jgi:hypothetical protein
MPNADVSHARLLRAVQPQQGLSLVKITPNFSFAGLDKLGKECL